MYIKKAFPTKIIYIYRQVDSIRDAKSKKAMKWKKKKAKNILLRLEVEKKVQRKNERKKGLVNVFVDCVYGNLYECKCLSALKMVALSFSRTTKTFLHTV